MRNSKWLSLLMVLTSCLQNEGVRDSPLPRVQEVDLASIHPDMFAEEEWYMPYYLKHFSAVANAVLDTGIDRGYLSLSVWRGSQNNHTYNARIMEGIMSLVWFYTSDRSWNPYYGDTALKARIEAALTFWCNIQNEDGKFSEYATGKWSLAPTAFATKFIGRALWLLDKGPGIDKAVYERARLSLRKAIFTGLTDKDLWETGTWVTNQYANLWGGALMYLDIWPDEEIETNLRKRFARSMSDFQSPAGYFYEKDGPDFKYNMGTHHSDLQVAWHYSKGKEFNDEIVKKTNDWYDWFSYNAVREPGSSCYYLNSAIDTRQRIVYILDDELKDPALARWVPQAEFIPLARAFQLSQQDLEVSQKQKYDVMRNAYPRVKPLEVGEFNAFTPYAFLHEGMDVWLPSQAEKEEAIAGLPYLAKTEFIHVRKDSRNPLSFTFVRRPSYYAAFNSGKILTDQQRYGLGLLWNPNLGTVMQSQSGSSVAAYGTTAEGVEKLYEAGDVFTRMLLKGQIIEPGIGKNDFEGEDLWITYNLGESGKKEIFFKGDNLIIRIMHPGKFIETIPLLKSADDELIWNGSQIILENSGSSMIIDFRNSSGIDNLQVEGDFHTKVCHSFKISAEESLEYMIHFK